MLFLNDPFLSHLSGGGGGGGGGGGRGDPPSFEAGTSLEIIVAPSDHEGITQTPTSQSKTLTHAKTSFKDSSFATRLPVHQMIAE